MDLALEFSGPVLGGLAFAIALYAAAISQRSTPSKMLHRIANLNEVVEFLTAEMEKHAIRITGWKGEMETVLDNVDNVLGQVERKRKSIAATESRMNGGNAVPAQAAEVNPQTLNAQELERYARARGMLGVN